MQTKLVVALRSKGNIVKDEIYRATEIEEGFYEISWDETCLGEFPANYFKDAPPVKPKMPPNNPRG